MHVHRVALLGAALLAPSALASHAVLPLNLTQQAPLGTTLAAGGTSSGTTVYLTASSDGQTCDGAATYSLEFEIRPTSSSYTGAVTHSSPSMVKSNCQLQQYPFTTVSNLTAGISYKWRVREKVTGGSLGTNTSGWSDFNSGLAAFTLSGVQVTPTSAAFGVVRVGQTSPSKTVEVSNDTTSAVTVNSAAISAGAPFSIISGPSLPLALASGSKATFTISAAPMSVGSHNGTFTVTSTAPNSPHSATLTVTGGLPILSLPSTSVSFGDVGINGAGLTVNLQVKNNGNAALTLLGGSVAAPFAVSPAAAGLTIAAGQTENVPVTFAPTALGPHSGSLTLTSDDPNSPHTVSLSGTGIDPKVALSDAQVSFANTIINATATSSTITLSNTGTGTLVLGPPTVTGPFTTTLAAVSVVQGDSTTFTVTFAPTSPGAKTGSVIIPSNDGTSPATLPLSGFALAPVLAAAPASHSFGTVSLGSSPSTTITLTNAGDTTLNVSALGLSGSNTSEFALSGVPAAPFTIGAGATQQFSVAFTPAHVGIRAAEIVIQSDRYPAGAFVIPLSGTGDGARVSLAPSALDFGKLNIGEGSDRTFVIGNSGSAPLTVSGLTFGGASSTDYATAKGTPFTVSPGASSSVTVTFRPSAVGARQADLTVASNDALAPSGQVGLSGEGISPAVAVDPALLAFGPVRVAQTLTRSVSISNTGNGPLSIGSVAITGQDAAKFSIVTGSGSFVIAPGAPDRVISVRFSPTALSAASAELAIVTDDPTSPNVSVPLSGEGVSPGLTVSTTEINFGGQPVGLASAPRTFAVTNSGSTTLQVSSVALSGADAASYAIPSPLGAFALAPGGEKQVQVVVSPKRIGEHAAKVVVTTDAAESPTAEVQLATLGISDVLSVDQSALAFGAVRVNQEAPPKQVVLSSAAADAVPLAGAWFTGTGAAHFAVELSAATVDGGGSVTATVRYRPKNASTHSAELVLASALTRVPEVRIPVAGTGLSRMFDLSQASLEFGAITVGESTEQVVTLTNKTGAAVTITGLSTSNDEFAAVTPLPLTVEAGADARLTISFSPAAAHAAFAHAAVLVNNAPESSPEVIVALSGTGVEEAGCSASSGSMALWAVAFAAFALLARRRRAAQTLPLALAVVAVFTGGTAFGVTFTPSTTSFNIVRVGQTSSAETVQIVNNSAVAVTLQSTAVTGPFSISSADTLPVTLAANGGTSSWSVTAAPTATGVHTGTFSATTDESATPFTATLTVTGGLPDLLLPPATIAMGEATVNGAAVSKNVTIQNAGNLPLVISTATGSGAFSASGVAGVTVGAGLAHTFQVSFAPTTAGYQTGTISIASDDPDSPHTLSVSGLGSSPQLSLSVASVAFPDTHFNASSDPITVTLTNTGVGTLSVAAPVMTGPFSTTLAAGNLAAGASKTFAVTFTPLTPGAKTGSIQIASNDAASPATVSLSGFARAPELTSTPTSYDFGPVGLAVSQTTTLTLSNPGDTTLHVTDVKVAGTNASDFTLQGAPTTPFTIASGGSRQLSVRFAPTSAGGRSAQLEVQSDRYPTGTFAVLLLGTGSGPRILVTPATLNYGFVNVGATKVDEVTIENVGSAPLTVSGLIFNTGQPNDYVASEAPPFTLQPGASKVVTVTVKAAAVGLRNSKLTIASDDPISPGVDVALLATGVAPSIAVSPSSINFGAMRVGTENTRTVAITNPGSGTLFVSAALITGGDVAAYTVSPIGIGFAVPPNAPQRQINVKFKPPVVGASATWLVIVCDDPETPQVAIPLTGEGISPALTLSATELNFGAQPVGRTSGFRSFKIRNTGTAGMQISGLTLAGTGSSSFALKDAAASFSIPVAGEKEIVVSTTPRLGGEQVARVEFATDVPGVPKAQVNLVSLGITTALSVSQTSLTFGAVKAKTEAAPLQLTVHNAAADPLELSPPVIAGASAAQFGVALSSTTVPAHGSVIATVRYAPASAGSHSAELTLGSAVPGAVPIKVSVSGTAVSQKLDAAPAALEFGNVEVGLRSENVLTLTNKTDFPVVVTGFNFSEPGYSSLTKLPFAIPPGESTKAMIAFEPTMPGIAVGTLDIVVDNETAPEITVSVAATGSEASGCSAGGGAAAAWALLALVLPMVRRRRAA